MLNMSEAVHLLLYFMACMKTNLLLPLPQNKYKPGTCTEITADGKLIAVAAQNNDTKLCFRLLFPCAMQKTRVEVSKYWGADKSLAQPGR